MLARTKIVALTTALIGALALGGNAYAARKTCPDGGFPPCNKPPVTESGGNNLSYPVIWAEGVVKADFTPTDTAWKFQAVLEDGMGGYYTDVGQGPVYCVGEEDVVPPATVPDDVLCYHGRLNLGISEETGQREFVEPPKVWWLQQRQPFNQWQVFNRADPFLATPVVVTGVDTGDLLESSITIKAKQIRTEFTLFKNVSGDPGHPNEKIASIVADPDFLEFRPEYPCELNANDDAIPTAPNNCFAAHSMSGAVPGTDQSIAETQGTEYPFEDQALLLDPRDVKMAKSYFDPSIVVPAGADPGTEAEETDPRIVAIDPPLGMDATVYTACARLLIQKLTGDPATLYWDSVEGSWMPRSAINTPAVDIRTWDGSYSVEINAGGSLIYGYNWNTKNFAEGAGEYRLTFLIEGSSADGGRCIYDSNAVFDDTSLSVNVGDRRPATILTPAALGATRGEGGAVYVDVEIGTSGGGGGGRPR
jgi:hypothetical protein